jgi:HK97 family phage prohead protease
MHNSFKDKKLMMKYRTMVLKSTTSKSTGLTTVTASSPTPDRYEDVVQADWNLDHFKGNPVVLWGHDYSIPPVGRVVDIAMDGGDLVASIEWDDSADNPLGRTVASQFKRGFLNAVSVGFTPGATVERAKLDEDDPAYGDKGMAYTNNELMEISAVPIPAHRGALAMRSAAAPSVGKHILAVEETDEAWVISYAKGQEAEPAEDEEEPAEDEDELMEEDTTRAPEDEDEDEDEQKLKHLVRSVLLDMMGTAPGFFDDNYGEFDKPTNTPDPLAELLGIDK